MAEVSISSFLLFLLILWGPPVRSDGRRKVCQNTSNLTLIFVKLDFNGNLERTYIVDQRKLSLNLRVEWELYKVVVVFSCHFLRYHLHSWMIFVCMYICMWVSYLYVSTYMHPSIVNWSFDDPLLVSGTLKSTGVSSTLCTFTSARTWSGFRFGLVVHVGALTLVHCGACNFVIHLSRSFLDLVGLMCFASSLLIFVYGHSLLCWRPTLLHPCSYSLYVLKPVVYIYGVEC